MGVIEHQEIHKWALSSDKWKEIGTKFLSNESLIVIEDVKTNTIIELHRID